MSEPDTNFPLKVVCHECRAAIGARCRELLKPPDPHGFKATINAERYVDWFHFSRIEKAKLQGLSDAS